MAYREMYEQYKRRERRNFILRHLLKNCEILSKYLTEQQKSWDFEDEGDPVILEDALVMNAINDMYELLNHAYNESYEIRELARHPTQIEDMSEIEKPVQYCCTLEDIKKLTLDIEKARKTAERGY